MTMKVDVPCGGGVIRMFVIVHWPALRAAEHVPVEE
jgi:hypothetical protein